MVAPFTLKEYKKPNFFQVLLKLEPTNNYRIAIENILAEKVRIDEISNDDITAIEKKYKIDIFSDHRDNLCTIFKKYLEYCLIDTNLSSDELKNLEYLKKVFGLSDRDVNSIFNDVGQKVYSKSIEQAISDGKLSDKERDFLRSLQTNLKLDDKIAKSILQQKAKPYIDQAVQEAISDERLSPEEEQELAKLIDNLGVEYNYTENTKAVMDKYRTLWKFENADLPTFDCDIILKKNEKCHFVNNRTNLLSEKINTRQVRYGGITARQKLLKGVYLRVGELTINSEPIDGIKSTKGCLYITNQRFLFKENSQYFGKTLNIKHTVIVDFKVGQNGIQLFRENGNSVVFYFGKDYFKDNVEYIVVIISRLIRDANS